MQLSEYHRMAKVEYAHFWYRAMGELTITILRKNINSKVNILDAGCGTGGMTKKLEEFGRVTGVDISQLALDYARKKGLKDLLKASVCDLPFPDKSFDVIVTLDVLYHKKVEDDMKALQEFYRVLKPKGIILLRVPAFEFLRGNHDIIVETRHRYTSSEIKEKLETVGFKIRKLSYVNMLLSIPLFFKRTLERIKKPNSLTSDTEPLPKVINELFYYLLKLENNLLNYTSLPFGSSVVCLGEKLESEK